MQITRSGNRETDGVGSQSEGADLSRRRWMSQPPGETEFTFPLHFCPGVGNEAHPPSEDDFFFFFGHSRS